MYEDEFTQTVEQAEEPPFETGIGGQVGGDIHIDGTPLRTVVIVGVAVFVAIAFYQSNFRWHMVV